MYPPGPIQMAVAIAILLSVIVRAIRSGASWAAVEDGAATAEHLRDITGIRSREALLEAFGPPRLEDGVFPVTPRAVRAARTNMGYLLGDRWLDGGSALVALASMFPIWPLWETLPLLNVLLTFAALYQVAGWWAAAAMGRKG
jgi:hypothetical protein